MLVRAAVVIGFCLFLSACIAAQRVDYYDSVRVDAPKVIAIAGDRMPWVPEIERRLRQRGFEVLRWANTSKVTERSGSREETFRESTTRFVVFIEGRAPMNRMERCFGGGFNFDYINVELVDVQSNRTIASVSDAGYSEGCPPAISSMFEDIANAIDKAWK